MRFQRENGRWVASVVVGPEHRGKGHASELIALGTAEVAGPVDAFIKPGNEASVRAFRSAGYDDAPSDDENHHLTFG